MWKAQPKHPTASLHFCLFFENNPIRLYLLKANRNLLTAIISTYTKKYLHSASNIELIFFYRIFNAGLGPLYGPSVLQMPPDSMLLTVVNV